MDVVTNKREGPFGLQLISMSGEVSYSTINLSELDSLIHILNQRHIKKDVLENLSQSYKLQTFNYDPSDLPIIAANIEERACRLQTQRARSGLPSEGHWYLGEKSLFFCVLGFYAHLHRLTIQNLKQVEIFPLQKIFCSKSPKTLLFQVKHLFSLHVKVDWFDQDVEILENLMNSHIGQEARSASYGIKWKQLAYQLFMQSNSGEFYSARDCRNKWLSHLSPEITKDSWTTQEELRLCELALQTGTKWSQISRKMGGVRTEHMVKNKANALMRRVFKKKFKTITGKHLEKIIDFLKIRAKVESEKEHQVQESLQIIDFIESEKIVQKVSNAQEQKVFETCQTFDFDKPFNNISSSRLIMISEDMGDTWQYKEEPFFNDFNNYFSFD